MVLGLAVVLVVAAAVLFTLFVRKQDLPAPEPVSPTRHLEERKAAIYENLRDLQFEYRVGKLSDADYQQTKLGLQKELAGVIAQIEQIEKRPAVAPAQPASPKPRMEIKCKTCGAVFAKPMKFCGECGKAMS
ncbi:MAG TPA: hypothetical protein VKV74_05245 [Bryobacteraceae bacterium]|nr:hypothetical protein [Bryobacteraceae bacterium]